MTGRQSQRILIEDLWLSFGETEVLKGVDLEIAPGEFFAFLGPSGSGKSTLLRAIAGFGPRPEGRILIGEENVTDLPPWTRNVGMVFQSYALWPHMTVRRNVAFGLEERGVARREIGPRVEKALEMVGLLELAERRPSQLSGGQQQRVALARTIVVEPRVLLLDEPLSNLDANLRAQMRREILELQRALGITTIFVTHDQEEANTMADRMAVLDDGVIQQVGPPMELYDNPANLFVAGFLGSANQIPGRIENKDGERRFVAEGGIVIPLPADEPEGPATAVFRPQNIHLLSENEVATSSELCFTGTIVHSEFLGALIRYSLDLAGCEILVDEPHQSGQQVLPAGSQVTASITADQVRILRS